MRSKAEMAPIRHLIITGAGGYLGRGLVAAALAEGRSVTALGRGSHGLPAGVRRVNWSLGEALPRACLDPALAADQQALVHLAHDWRERTPGDDRNRAGSLLLRDGARGSGQGLGLGLSIARTCVQAHGGDVALTNRLEGGLRASIRLPA